MSRILCSTGAIIGKPSVDNFALLKRLSTELTCDGFEFIIEFHMYEAGYEDVEEHKRLLKELNLCIPVVHCDKIVGEYISIGGEEKTAEAYRLFEINCDFAKDIGAEKLVLHLWGGMASDGHIQNNIDAYPRLKEISERYGLDLLVENVVCNTENPMKHLCELWAAYQDIHFLFDTNMAAFHEELELLYDAEYDWLWKEGHIRHYHVNDYAGGYMDWSNLSALPVGMGKLDFEQFFAFVKSTGYDGDITTEGVAFDEEGNVNVELLNQQFAYIREKMNED
jgi:sugar phosphate isomerase/epimerase